MKLFIHSLVAIGVAALLMAGCSDETSEQPAAGNQPAAGVTPPKPPPAQPPKSGGEPETAPTTEVTTEPNESVPALPEPGDPGSITGRAKSPFTRLAMGVVYIKRVDGVEFEPPTENPVMDQKNLIFIPHVLPVLAGSTVNFPNSDTVRHNVFSGEDSAATFNLGQYDVGAVKHVTFEEVGVTHLGCNVHAEMSAYIVACQNPYFGVMDKRGNFAIPNVPPGKWQLTFFHEKIKEKAIEVVVKSGEETQVEFADLQRR